jgi:uncharacterized protein (TIGR02145 family)
MRKHNLITIIILFTLSVLSQTKSVKIGTQTWSTKNLNVSTFRNGDSIPEAKTDAEWKEAGAKHKPVWCYVKSDSSYITKTDKLYNWPAVNDPRGLTPKGWHVPSKLEWEKLIEYLGGTNIAGKKLKSKKGWASNVNVKNGNGNNVSGFNAYPAFWRHAQGKMHEILGFGAYFWSTTEIDEEFKYENDAWTFNLFALTDQAIIRLENKPYGLAVRCIKD